MTKDEIKNRISMELKDPILQQGFEIICKENAELKKENELFKRANEIIAQQRDDRDTDISKLESRIEELEEQLEKRKVFLLQRVDSYDNSIDKQFYTTDEELAKEWNDYYKRNYWYGQAIELEKFSNKDKIIEELESD